MKEIRFTIKGNPDDIEGNPVPYARVVGRALWLPHAKKYHAWKQYVRAIFHRAYPEFPIGKVQPLTTKMSAKALLAIDIYWVNGAHADPDNIFKGIADALFENDKYLDGIFESHYASDGKGRVEVEIYLNLEK